MRRAPHLIPRIMLVNLDAVPARVRGHGPTRNPEGLITFWRHASSAMDKRETAISHAGAVRSDPLPPR